MLLLLLLISGHGAHALTSEQVLKTAWMDQTYLAQDEIQDTNSKNPLRTVEAFVSSEKTTKNSSKDEFEYGLKFQFKSWPEWQKGRSQESEKKLLRESSLAWALRDRYAVLVTYDLSQKKLEILKDAALMADRNVHAQGLALKAGRTTSKSYLKSQVDQLKLKRALTSVQEELSFCKRKIQQWLPEWKGDDVQDAKAWSAEEIERKLQDLPAENASLSKKIATEELNQLSDELIILKGREDQWVKGLQVAQTNKDKEVGYEVGLTFQIPGLGHDELNRQKQNQIILKKALKQRDIENINDQVKNLRLQILNQVELYKLSKAALARPEKPGADPLINIENKLEERQEQFELLTQQQQIANMYLDYLVESELLSKEPEKNQLILVANGGRQ